MSLGVHTEIGFVYLISKFLNLGEQNIGRIYAVKSESV